MFCFLRHLIETMVDQKVDLIVIEGMGRSLHTNLNSSFKCESLKLAVIKVGIKKLTASFNEVYFFMNFRTNFWQQD